MRRVLVGLAIMAGLASPAAAQRRAEQPAWEPPPSREDVPHYMLGFVRYGETVGAAVACGLRSLPWAETYRMRLYEAIRASHHLPSDVENTLRATGEYEAYARRTVEREQAHRQRGYCAWVANPADMATADSIVQGAQPFPIIRALTPAERAEAGR